MPGPSNESDLAETETVPRRVWRATALLVAGRAWGALCTFLVLALLARHVDAGEFGRYTFYLAVFTLLEGLVDFGTSTAALQHGAHDRWALTAAVIAGRRIRGAAATLAFLVLVLASWLGGEHGPGWIALAALIPFTRTLELSGVVFQSAIAWRTPVAIRALAATLRVILAATLLHTGVEEYGPFLLAHVAAGGVGNVLLYLAARARIPRPSIPIVPARGLLAVALPLAAAGVAQQAYFYVDNLFVRGFRGDAELGHYNAAVRLLSFSILVAVLATNAALPWLARAHRRGELGPATANLAQGLFLAACPVLGCLWPFADTLLQWLFGPAFVAAAPSLRWLFVAAAAIYAGAGLLTAVVASGRTRAVLAIAIGGLAVNVVGNLALVPTHGSEGAAIATVVTEIWVAGASLVVLLRAGERVLVRWWAWALAPLGFLLCALVLGA